MSTIRLFILLVMLYSSQISFGQCPVINGAMVNSCAAGGTTEGNNEFVYFTTNASAAISSYKFYYGSNTPATQSPTGILSGTHAAAKTGTGSIIVQNGCTLHEVTSPTTVIPENSSVAFIPYNFDQQYDMSSICKNGDLYVVYIDITAATDSKWSSNGTMANAATSLRYLQLVYNSNTCVSGIRSYNSTLWANPGNTPEADGNALAWDAAGNTLYVNNGCSVIVTPVKLASFNALKKDKDALITWNTTNEINAQYFEVQWSSDGTNFKTIYTSKATGNSDTHKSYAYIDKNINGGNNFYRLKSIDTDGKFSYSPIVKINFSGSSLINVFPQLTSGNLNIEINAIKNGETNTQIFDHTGRLLSSYKTLLTAGYNRVLLNVSHLPAGGYILKISDSNGINIAHFTRY